MEKTIYKDSCWKGINYKKFKDSEVKVIEVSGIDPSEFKSYPVEFEFDQDFLHELDSHFSENLNSSFIGLVQPMSVGDKDPYTNEVVKPIRNEIRSTCCCVPCCCKSKLQVKSTEYMMTYEFGDPEKPQIVLFHGFMGSGVIFFKLFKRLTERYHVIMVDFIGMGSSSRPHYFPRTKDEADAFFIQSIEKWRRKMNIDKMNIVAHSLGCYIGAKYAVRFPQVVKKLILLSPLGCEIKQNNIQELFKKKINNCCKYNCLMCMANCIFKYKINFYNILRIFPRCLGKMYLKSYIGRKFESLTKEEKNAFYEYLYCTTMYTTSGEHCLFKLTEYGLFCHTPILNDLGELQENGIQISIMFGDKDWMDSDFSGIRISQKLQESGFKVTLIKNADHLLFLDNPEEVADTLDEAMGNNGA